MAIEHETYTQSGINPAALSVFTTGQADDWKDCLRVRMSMYDFQKYGMSNVLRIRNKSFTSDAQIRFGLNIEDGKPTEVLPRNSVVNISIKDGKRFLGFDVMCLDAADEIAIGEIEYSMRQVITIPEHLVIPR